MSPLHDDLPGPDIGLHDSQDSGKTRFRTAKFENRRRFPRNQSATRRLEIAHFKPAT
jgi:hypothetical protein